MHRQLMRPESDNYACNVFIYFYKSVNNNVIQQNANML